MFAGPLLVCLYFENMSEKHFPSNTALDHARDARTSGDLGIAAALYEDAARTADPVLRIDALLGRAAVCTELQRYDDALLALQQALATDPGASRVWGAVGAVCSAMGRLAEAREAFERAYRCDPGRGEYLVNLGAIALRVGDPGNALQYLDCAIDLDATHTEAHVNRALTLAVFGRIEEAEESLRLAVLHGFTQPDPIMERIARMRAVRERILGDAVRENTGTPDADAAIDQQDALQLLLALEREHARRLATPESADGESDTEQAVRMDELRRQIDTLSAFVRRSSGDSPPD
jgi:tetratricopeptide (TPR) repeat protein